MRACVDKYTKEEGAKSPSGVRRRQGLLSCKLKKEYDEAKKELVPSYYRIWLGS